MNKITIISVLTMLGLGVGFALLLSLAYKYFKVKEDPNVEKINQLLPGLNCGTCGFTSCNAYAEHVVKDKTLSPICLVGGKEVSDEIAKLIGVDLKNILPVKAIVHCGGTKDNVKTLAEYKGVDSCQAAQLVKEGFLACTYGCLGLEDCVRACPINAIKIINGLAQINIDKCIGCGKCIKTCPRDIISLEELNKDRLIKISCNSNDPTKTVREACKVGCIACKICETKGPEGVFKVEDNLSKIDYKKVNEFSDFKTIIQICPTKCIKEDILGEESKS